MSGLEVSTIYGILEGYTIDAPQIKREGFILEGWYIDAANTNKFDFENDCVTSHMTLFAKWVAIKPVVTFETGAGSAVDAQTLAYNGVVSLPKNPVCSGYVFGGWFEDEECTAVFDFATEITMDLTLYAKWERIDYTVTFETNGGTPVASAFTNIENAYKISEPVSIRQYYVLDGWYKDALFLQKFYFESEITEDTTLYAKWTPAKATVQFVDSDGVSPVYDAVGAIISARETNVENAFQIAAPMPEKEGYTFEGWYLNGILLDLSSYAEFLPREEAYTLVAKWSINSYAITFDCDGGSAIAPINQKYGSAIASPADPSKIGYAFDGWDSAIPATMPAENMTIANKPWQINQYTITFVVDGEVYHKITKDYGAAITVPANPTKIGYTFASWDRAIPETMPAENITINASFTELISTIDYKINTTDLDGDFEIKGSVKTLSYVVSSINTARAITYSNTYVFRGWYTAATRGKLQIVTESYLQMYPVIPMPAENGFPM